MRILDIPNWPPESCGTFPVPTSYCSPCSEQAILKRTEATNGGVVTFICEFEGQEHKYFLDARSPRLADKVENTLRASFGKSVMWIGFLEIDD
jgi:hypothetical protein